MISIYALKLQTIEPEIFERLLLYTSEERRSKIRRFVRAEDAQRSLMGDILVKNIIAGELNIKKENAVISRNKFGKPYLEGRDDFHFNVSHSNEWVVCAAGGSPVGADIEYMAPIDPQFVERFFSEDEFTDLILREPGLRGSYFYDLWTIKESYIKAVGKGLFIPLDSFTVKVEKDGKIKFKSLFDSSKYHFSKYDLDGNYRVSLCSSDPVHNENIIIKEQGRINDELLSDRCWS